MGKKRSGHLAMPSPLKLEIKDEIADNEVLVARDRLKGALEELMHHSDSESSNDSSEDNAAQDYHKQTKKNRDYMMARKSNYQPRKIKRRRQIQPDTPFQHTYVMKLFDRSVDLAQFQEDTPLYPICRAWMANQPRNPSIVPKVRSPSPEIVREMNSESELYDSSGELRDVFCLPPPLPSEEALPKNRIPSPIPIETEELDLNYDEQILKSREQLLQEHRAHWTNVRKKWHQTAHKNEKRFLESANILSTIFKKAQSEFE